MTTLFGGFALPSLPDVSCCKASRPPLRWRPAASPFRTGARLDIVFENHFPRNGLRSARNLSGSSAAVQLLAGSGETLPDSARYLVADPRARRRGRGSAAGSLRGPGLADSRRQAVFQVRGRDA